MKERKQGFPQLQTELNKGLPLASNEFYVTAWTPFCDNVTRIV